MALAHPKLAQDARESIACDYYVDALDDPDFALKNKRASTHVIRRSVTSFITVRSMVA